MPPTERLVAPGHFAFDVMLAQGIEVALHHAEGLGTQITATPWEDVRRAWQLSEASLRYADALYVAAAERLRVPLLTAHARIDRSGAHLGCRVVTVVVGDEPSGAVEGPRP